MGGYPVGYPDIRQDSRGKGASAPESAPAGGYPLALAGIRQRITDIRNRLSATISITNHRCDSLLVLCKTHLFVHSQQSAVLKV
ncbi:hypothetical protein PGT21_009246 [Puccinia graminis f. sp. tritici]|uniref:Uncharacterized protein n=1 Tax=Puccinia graminis f. sp. tritici TaxID=56615 RepID=A0A5B0Q5K0_PUCGR|nr:hypothetical protein PGT21_009246 [Puccinia graminis f. sp. tritici]